MNITFLIGNGFDLNLGLPTGYTDFIKYHREQGLTDMISMAIRDDYQTWSNVESALGEFTANVSQENLEEFAESKCTLDESLSDYLTHINDAYALTLANDGAAEFRKKILNLSQEFNETDRSTYNSTLLRVGESIQYCFVSFNYTDYLDRIVNAAGKIEPFYKRNANGKVYSDDLKAPIHVHGMLGGNAILGVNDDSQVLAPDDIKRQLSALMLKPEINTSLGERRTEHAKELIQSSRYVLVYGMSLGKTDAMWWKLLAEWLKGSSDRRIVLYTRSPKINNKSASRTIMCQNEKRNEFLKAANCTDTTISKQIIVVPNTKVFTFDSISISPATADERTEAV